MSHRKKNAVFLLLAFLMSGNTLFAKELPNSKILGAIPQSFDNIGIIRYIDMDADTVVGSEFLREVPAAMPAPTHAMPVHMYIAERLQLDGLSIAAFALSNQDTPASMDSSGRNRILLYVAEHNTADLMQSVSTRRDIQQVDHAQYEVYRDNAPGNPTYVAFLDETMILVTNNEDDIAESGPALLAQDSQPTPHWSMLNVVDMNAPALILRHLQYPMIPPPGADVPHHDNFVLGMWMSDLSAPIFQMEVSTDVQRAEAQEYIRTVGAIEALSGPEGMALNLEQPDAPGSNYTGTLEVVHSEMGDHYTDLVFIWLLGNWFAI